MSRKKSRGCPDPIVQCAASLSRLSNGIGTATGPFYINSLIFSSTVVQSLALVNARKGEVDEFLNALHNTHIFHEYSMDFIDLTPMTIRTAKS